jgi:glycine/D-amino acid oxidase-like deaminating enzyme
MPPPSLDVAVVGCGLAGGLLALELADLGLRVQLVDGQDEQPACASHWSYGAIAPLAGGSWPRLQRRHGDLGWRRTWFRPLGPGAPVGGRLPLPCSRVDAAILRRRLPLALERAGVGLVQGRVERLLPPEGVGQPWRLRLRHQDEPLAARQVVLAAGAGCRALWPDLPPSLRVSWAGVLLLQPQPGGWPWGGPVAMRLPARFQRLALEAQAPSLGQEDWQVDPGLLPWGEDWLAGQISLVRPGLGAGAPPDGALQEERLRQALAPLLPALAHWPGTFLQVPVSFCSDGEPLAGPVAAAPGLWVFAGFSAAFTAIPPRAAGLARLLATDAVQKL